MTAPKTLGQIAFEASDDETYRDWIEIFPQHRNEWERIGAAVAAAHQKRVAGPGAVLAAPWR